MRRWMIVMAVLAMTLTTLIPAAAAQTSPLGDGVAMADPASGRWTLRDAGGSTTSFYFGDPGDFPLFGDWDGDGIDTPAAYRQTDGRVYVRNSNSEGIADTSFFFGDPGDVPIAGDWDGDGVDTISVYRPSTSEVFVINELGADGAGLGPADYSFVFGNPGDLPFVGDFDGDGVDGIGLHRPETGEVYYRNALSTGLADSSFYYGDPGDQMFAGDWDGNGIDTLGVFRAVSGTVYLRNSNTAGAADFEIAFGGAGQWALSGTFELLDIVETARAAGFDTLVAALEATEGSSNLATALQGEGPFTVFAPTEDAFAALPAGTIETLLGDPGGLLTDILLYHVVAGEVPAADVVDLDMAETLLGQNVWIDSNGGVFINDAQVVVTDVRASNGIIHVIDTVLQPLDIVETAQAAGFATLVAALEATEGTSNLATALRGDGPFTVFAPTEDAFAALPAGTIEALLADPGSALTDILTYHVLTGEYDSTDVVALDGGSTPATLNGASITVDVVGDAVILNQGLADEARVLVVDIQTTNGIIHVIDGVLIPSV